MVTGVHRAGFDYSRPPVVVIRYTHTFLCAHNEAVELKVATRVRQVEEMAGEVSSSCFTMSLVSKYWAMLNIAGLPGRSGICSIEDEMPSNNFSRPNLALEMMVRLEEDPETAKSAKGWLPP